MTEMGLWDIATAEIAEQGDRRRTAHVVSAAERAWPFLSEALSEAEFTTRLTMVEGTLSKAAATEGERSMLEDHLTDRFRAHHAARQAEVIQQQAVADLAAKIAAACPTCKGSGSHPWDAQKKCPKCKGTGNKPVPKKHRDPDIDYREGAKTALIEPFDEDGFCPLCGSAVDPTGVCGWCGRLVRGTPTTAAKTADRTGPTIDSADGYEYTPAPDWVAKACKRRFEGGGQTALDPKRPGHYLHGIGNWWDGPHEITDNGDHTLTFKNPYNGDTDRFDETGYFDHDGNHKTWGSAYDDYTASKREGFSHSTDGKPYAENVGGTKPKAQEADPGARSFHLNNDHSAPGYGMGSAEHIRAGEETSDRSFARERAQTERAHGIDPQDVKDHKYHVAPPAKMISSLRPVTASLGENHRWALVDEAGVAHHEGTAESAYAATVLAEAALEDLHVEAELDEAEAMLSTEATRPTNEQYTRARALLREHGVDKGWTEYSRHKGYSMVDWAHAVMDHQKTGSTEAAHPNFPGGVPFFCPDCGHSRTLKECETCDYLAEQKGHRKGPSILDYLMHGLFPSGATAAKTAGAADYLNALELLDSGLEYGEAIARYREGGGNITDWDDAYFDWKYGDHRGPVANPQRAMVAVNESAQGTDRYQHTDAPATPAWVADTWGNPKALAPKKVLDEGRADAKSSNDLPEQVSIHQTSAKTAGDFASDSFVPVKWHVYRVDFAGRGVPVEGTNFTSKEQAEIGMMGLKEREKINPKSPNLNPRPVHYLVAEDANGMRLPYFGEHWQPPFLGSTKTAAGAGEGFGTDKPTNLHGTEQADDFAEQGQRTPMTTRPRVKPHAAPDVAPADANRVTVSDTGFDISQVHDTQQAFTMPTFQQQVAAKVGKVAVRVMADNPHLDVHAARKIAEAALVHYPEMVNQP